MVGNALGPLEALREVRARIHGAGFVARRDALQEILDALLVVGAPPSLPHLSLAPGHRRGWGSVYAALQRGRLDTDALRGCVGGTLAGEADRPALYALDATAWPRCDAETSPERGHYYHPSRHSAGQPIVTGWSYSWLARLDLAPSSWTAPCDARRVRPTDDPYAVVRAQVEAVLPPACGLPAPAPVPWIVADAGYDPAQLAAAVGNLNVAVLVRLACHRVFYRDVPPPVPGSRRPRGRPAHHGERLDFRRPSTRPTPSEALTVADAHYGQVTVEAWRGFHSLRAWRVSGTVVHVVVERLPGRARKPQELWLWWSGPGLVDLALAWRAYIRRFDLEHTFRFLKQRLGWTMPRVRLPEQADRWTWLVLLAYTLLRLARPVVQDRRLPWERGLPPARITPGRVLRAFPAVLVAVGTPAAAPKPCGRSPGRPKGRTSAPARRYPAIKRAA